MICRNCGFQNAAGDEFCGSCGQFLEWSGEAATDTTTSPGTGTGADPAATGLGTGMGGAATGAGAAAAGPTVDSSAPTTVSATPPPPWPTTDRASTPSVAQPTGGGPDVICWNCGRRNPPTRSFCQQCGERLTAGKGAAPTAGMASGTTTRRAAPTEGSGRRLLPIAAGVVVVLLLLVGGVVFLPGLLGSGGPSVTPTPIIIVTSLPTATGVAGSLLPSSPPPSGASTSPATSSAPPSDVPTPSASIAPTPPPTAPPTSPPTPTPAATSSGRFRCEPKTINDRSPTLWVVNQVGWKGFGGADRFTVTFVRDPSARAPNKAKVTVSIVPLDEVQSRFGVAPPPSGDLAVVIKMPAPIRFTGTVEKDANLTALKSFRLTGKGTGTVYAVLGVVGSGCNDFQIPLWAQFADPPSPSELVLDIQRP